MSEGHKVPISTSNPPMRSGQQAFLEDVSIHDKNKESIDRSNRNGGVMDSLEKEGRYNQASLGKVRYLESPNNAEKKKEILPKTHTMFDASPKELANCTNTSKILQEVNKISHRVLPMPTNNLDGDRVTEKTLTQEKKLPFVLDNPMRSVSNQRTNCSFNTVILGLIHCLFNLCQNVAEWIISPGSDNSQNQNHTVIRELVKLYYGETTDVTKLRQAIYPNSNLDENCDASEVLEDLVRNVPQLQRLLQFRHILLCYCYNCREPLSKTTFHSQFCVERDGTTTDFSTLLEKSEQNFHERRCPKCNSEGAQCLSAFDAKDTKILAIQLPIHNGRSLDQQKFTSRPKILNLFGEKWRLKTAVEFEGEDPNGHYTTWIEKPPGWIHSNDVTGKYTEKVNFKENCVNVAIMFYIKITGEEEPLPSQTLMENSAAIFLNTNLEELHTNAKINEKILPVYSKFNKEQNSNKWATKVSNAVDPNNSLGIVPGYDSTVIFGIGDDIKNEEDLEDNEVFHPRHRRTYRTTSRKTTNQRSNNTLNNRKRLSTQAAQYTERSVKRRNEEGSPSFSYENNSNQENSDSNNNCLDSIDNQQNTSHSEIVNHTSRNLRQIFHEAGKEKMRRDNLLHRGLEMSSDEVYPNRILEEFMPAVGIRYTYSLSEQKGGGRPKGTLKEEGAADPNTYAKRETDRMRQDNSVQGKKGQLETQIEATEQEREKYIEQLNYTYEMFHQTPAVQNDYLRECMEKLKNEREDFVDIKKVWRNEDVDKFYYEHPDKKRPDCVDKRVYDTRQELYLHCLTAEVNQYEWRTRLLNAIRDLLQSMEESVRNEELLARPTTGFENETNRSTNSYERNFVLAQDLSHESNNPAMPSIIRNSPSNQDIYRPDHVVPLLRTNLDPMFSGRATYSPMDINQQENNDRELFVENDNSDDEMDYLDYFFKY